MFFSGYSVVNLFKSVQTISIIACNSWLYLAENVYFKNIRIDQIYMDDIKCE